jgi:hypothetical protein
MFSWAYFSAWDLEAELLSQLLHGFRLADGVGSMPLQQQRPETVALAKAMYTTIVSPLTICALIYSLLYRTLQGKQLLPVHQIWLLPAHLSPPVRTSR